MITVAIVAILAAVAYPSYTRYIVRSNRSSAVSFVLNLASKQEQYNLDARQYTNQLSSLGATAIPSEVSSNYNVTVTADNSAVPPVYSVVAVPIGNQLVRDTQCGTLKIDQTGNKTVTGTGTVGSCW
ncbi:MAG: type IV pilin protein [Burkholderiaceae bacterium]